MGPTGALTGTVYISKQHAQQHCSCCIRAHTRISPYTTVVLSLSLPSLFSIFKYGWPI